MIGIIKLNTNFPRLSGDNGNPCSFDMAVEYETVELATVDHVVSAAKTSWLLIRQIIEAARRLERKNVKVIGTSCGILSLTQDTIEQAVSVPVLTSSLVMIPVLRLFF